MDLSQKRTVGTGSMGTLTSYLHAVVARRDLTPEEAFAAMDAILRQEATDAELGAFLVGLHMKGETAGELAAFARCLRKHALPVPFVPGPGETLLDTCGTGGDGRHTFNISTTAAFVVAACGVKVAKHGNRASSGLSGSADVLERLGVTIAVSGEQAAAALREVGICFLFAPAFHPAMRVAQGVRRELKMRTVFNLLGPLANPAAPHAQIVGASSGGAAVRMASALAELGLPRGYVLHGEDGLDEATITGSTEVFEIRHGVVRRFQVTPEEFGLKRASLGDLKGGGADENARITIDLLGGQKGPRRDIVLVNASMALMAAGRVEDPRDGARAAAEAIDSGEAREKLRLLQERI